MRERKKGSVRETDRDRYIDRVSEKQRKRERERETEREMEETVSWLDWIRYSEVRWGELS